MHGEGAVTDQMCQKWFVKFCAGDFSLDDASQLGRPVEVDSNQIETLRTINVITYGREPTYSKSKSIQLLVEMENVSSTLWKNLNRPLGQPSRL